MLKSHDKDAIRQVVQGLTTTLPDGTVIPRLGQGSWYMGDKASAFEQEFEALCTGVELGMTLIDTAEFYGSGRSERLISQVVERYHRDSLTLVSKVLPQNAGGAALEQSCNKSLRRLGVDCLDLYLLHWRGAIPLSETVDCLEKLRVKGKIRNWGVSNLDVQDMREIWRTPGGEHCSVNQVLYHLGSRGIEFALAPALAARGVPVMAYCPLAQGGRLRHGLLTHSAVLRVSKAHDATPVQVLLAFVLHRDNFIAIPKASRVEHVFDNASAALIELTDEEIEDLSNAFPAPARKVPLDLL